MVLVIFNVSNMSVLASEGPQPETFAAQPIRIDRNMDFNSSNGVVNAASADGSAVNPWVIENLTIDGTGYGYCLYIGNTTDYFIVRNCTLVNASGGSGFPYYANSGITFYDVINGNVTNANTSNNGIGIFFQSTNNNTLASNIILNNNYGIYLQNSPGNTIINNNVSSNVNGICAYNPYSSTIYHNNIYDNTNQAVDTSNLNLWNASYPIGGNYWSNYSGIDSMSGPSQDQPGSDGIGDTAYKIDDDSFDNYPLIKPAIDGRAQRPPIRIDSNSDFDSEHGVSAGNGTSWAPWAIENYDINGTGFGYCIYIGNTTDYFEVNNCNLHEASGVGTWPYYGDVGISLLNVTNGSLGNNMASYNQVGIYFFGSGGNTVADNNASDNVNGISFMGTSSNNSVVNNTAYSNNDAGINIGESSGGNTIIDNSASDNYDGIRLLTNGNTVSSNNISSNLNGIYVFSASGNIIEGNDFFGNNGNGTILLSCPSSNMIYHNNFINNTNQAYDDSTNIWDNGYPSGGNHWSDYAGIDNFIGPGQDIAGSDGIGDTPYTNIGGGAGMQDDYPLMASWGADNAPPLSAILGLSFSYWNNTGTVTVPWTATDDTNLANVSLMYNYSLDNATWGSWTWFDIQTASGTEAFGNFTFTCPEGQGYYQLRTNATDAVDKIETVLSDIAIFGYDGVRPISNANYISSLQATSAFDIPWGASEPIATGELAYALTASAAAWNGEYVYLFGGMSDGWVSTDAIMRYHPATNSIETLPEKLPHDLFNATAIYDGKDYYIFGGSKQTGGAANLNDITKYCPNNRTAYIVNVLPVTLTSLCAEWNGTHALIAAGYTGAIESRAIYAYDPSTNALTTLGEDLLLDGRHSASSVYADNKLYLFAGTDMTTTTGHNLTMVYDTLTNTTTYNASMPLPERFSTSAAWNGTRALIFGGCSPGPAANTDQIVEFNPLNNNMTVSATTFPMNIGYTSAIFNGTHVFIFGGFTGTYPGGALLTSIYRFNPKTGQLVNMNVANFTRVAYSGLKEIELWVSNSTDGVVYSSYSLYATKAWPDSSNFSFTGIPGTYYQFYTRARDNATNYEFKPPTQNDTWTFISNYRPDIMINGKINDVYESPSPINQKETQNLTLGGSASYQIAVQNDGLWVDNMMLIWDTSNLPASWSAAMVCNNNTTSVTSFMSGALFVGTLNPGGFVNYTLFINASTSASFNTNGSVGLGAFSATSGANDSAAAIAEILGLDYIVLTDIPNGAELSNVPMSAGSSVAVYASGYNVTAPAYIGLVSVNWLDTPDLGTFSVNTGTDTTFTAGMFQGIANITGYNITFDKIDNFTATISAETWLPITTLSIGTPNYTAGTDIFVNSSTQFSLTATDAGSGVASTWYRVWNGTWTDWIQYTGNFALNGTDGARHLEYYSIDVVGNHETTKNHTVIIDNTRPVSALTVGMPQYGTSPLYINTSTPLNLSAVDLGCGVYQIWYRIGAGSATWTLYTGNFTLSQAGSHTIYYYSVDNLNQTEAEKQFDVTVDINGPGASILFGVPNYGTAPTYINSSTLINLTGADAQSGLASLWYRLDTATTWAQYTNDFTVATPGTHTIYFYGINNLGQDGAVMSCDIFVDNTPPLSQISVGEPKIGTMPVNMTSSTEINITSSDPSLGCGVASIWYQVDSGAWTKYTSNFTLTGEGYHNISYNATDYLGQHEVSLSLFVFVDNIPPAVAVAPAPTAGTLEVNAGDAVTLTASDAGVGGEIIEYSTDGGATWQTYTGAITINENITIIYHAIDALGNLGQDQTLTVTIATEPPVTPSADNFIKEYWWILLMFIIVLLLVIILFFMMKGRKKDEEEDEEPDEPTEAEPAKENQTGGSTQPPSPPQTEGKP